MLAERIATIPSGEVELAAYEWRGAAVAAGGAADVPIVLLVHGYPDTHAVWSPLAEQLADHFRVLAYDVRGVGASTAPGSRRGYRLERLVDDQLTVLDTLAPGRRVHLVAHDWGSIQSWHTVTDARAPAAIASYTSVSGPCLDHAALWMRSALRSRSPKRWAQVLGQGLRSWYVVMFHLPLVAPLAWRLGLAKVLAGVLTAAEGAEPGGPDIDAGDQWPADTMAEDGRRGIQLYRANFLPRLLRPEARRTDIPVQLVVPTKDRYVSPALFQELDRWVSHLRRRELPGGHWMVRTEPEVMAGWIREVIGQVEPTASEVGHG